MPEIVPTPSRNAAALKLAAYALVAAALAWANIVTPLWADDYCRLSASGFAEPFALAWRDWFTWTGRFFVTAFTYLALGFGRDRSFLPFDLLNALVFVALVHEILRLARLATATSPRTGLAAAAEILFTALALWWLPRAIGEVALWKTGAIGYLWAVAGAAFIVRTALERGRTPPAWTLPFAFAIGTFLEPVSALTTLVLTALVVLRWREGRAPLSLAFAHALGTAVLIAAPGNLVRQATMPPSPLLDRLEGIWGNLGSLFDPLWIAAIALLLLPYIRALGWKPGLARAWLAARDRRALLFVALALVAMALLIGAPRWALSARVSFPASTLLVAYLVTIFLRRPPQAERIAAAALAAAFAASAAIVVPDLLSLQAIDAAWHANPALAAGPEADITLQKLQIRGRFVYVRKHIFYEGITADPQNFINTCFAAANHVHSVTAR